MIHFCFRSIDFGTWWSEVLFLTWSVRSTAQQEAVVQHELKRRDWPQVICRFDPAALAVQKKGDSIVFWHLRAHRHIFTHPRPHRLQADSRRCLLSGPLNMKRSGLEKLCKQWRSEAEIGCLVGCHSALVTGGVMGMSGMFLFHRWSGPLSKILLF